jgi:predicted nuclease of predicted toxin-antitoxin system
MRFLVDAQLPPALARWLCDQGYPADHVADLGMEASPDRAIWEWASKEGVVIVTKDEDFAIWRIASSARTPPVVWLRMGNTRRSELLEQMEFLLPQVLAGLERGEALIEIR